MSSLKYLDSGIHQHSSILILL